MLKKGINKLLSIFAIVIISFLIFLAIILGYLAGSMLEIAKEAPEVHAEDLLSNLKENSVIVDPDGNLIERIDTAEYRKIVPYEQIPKNLVNAFIAAEDRRFAQHDGVDLIGVAASVKDFAGSGKMRGASTITMQLARNVYLNNDINWTRKIQEIFLAYQIDAALDKDQIMESYLNRIFFGQNAYGVQAAAQIYFSKDVQDLDLAQCAAIASIVPAPSYYSLYSTYRPSQITDERVLDETEIGGQKYMAVYNPPAYERAKWVLKQMLSLNMISQEEYDAAIAEDVAATIDAPSKRAENISTYITDLVKDQAIEILRDRDNLSEREARQKLMYGGLTITSTVDMDLQRKLQNYAAELGSSMTSPSTGASLPLQVDAKYDDYGNIIGRDGSLLYYKKANLMDDENRVVLPAEQYTISDNGDLILHRGRIRGYRGYIDIMDYYSFDDNNILHTHKVGTIPIDSEFLTVNDKGDMTISKAYLDQNKVPLYSIRDDGYLILSPSYYEVDEIGVKQPQLALTVVDTKTGEVKAIIGGREQDDRHFLNRAASYPRQPGSSFKPIAEYTSAIALGYNQGVALDDTPVQMIDNEPWPSNVDHRYRGMTSMRDALIRSTNTIAVRWLEKTGMDVNKEYLRRYGIIDKEHPDRDNFVEKSENPNTNDENLALALGSMTHGITSLDLVGAYQAIGNNGQHIKPMSISKIVDNKGQVYYENQKTPTEVLPPRLNYQLIDLLFGVIKESFAADHFRSDDIPVAGKTGTSNYLMDFWFAASSPYYTTALWVGPDNALMSMKGHSGVAATVYSQVHDIIHAHIREAGGDLLGFEIPEGVYKAEVSMMSGQLPTKATQAAGKGAVRSIYVSDETKPTKPDDVYVFRAVDKRNNLLANSDLPDPLTVYRVFINRPSDYNPANFKGIVPEDWNQNVPTAYSDLPSVLEPVETTNPDGTKTRRVYNQEDASYTETTVQKDGSTKVEEFDPNGKLIRTVITPASSPGGTANPAGRSE